MLCIIHTKPGVADGVSFGDALIINEITKDALHVGLRVEFTANVAGKPCKMKVDIGFSDEIYPCATAMDYPPTLPDIPGARLQCYPAESVVAEKWQAMVQLKTMNSRMKDFHDLWFLSRKFSFDYAVLREAIYRTFERRQTDPAEYAALLEASYVKTLQPEWAAYVHKLKAANFQRRGGVVLPSRYFDEVLAVIIQWLEPVMQNGDYRKWTPGNGWRV